MSWETAAPAALQGVGSIVGALGQYNAGQGQADVARWNATNTLAQGTEAASRQGQQTEQATGQAVADYGAAGVDPNTGSPLLVRGQIAQQGALRQQDTLYNARLKALGLDYEADQAATAGAVSAGSTLLTGLGKIGGQMGWFTPAGGGGAGTGGLGG